jgi:hypothetical protein
MEEKVDQDTIYATMDRLKLLIMILRYLKLSIQILIMNMILKPLTFLKRRL